MVGEIIDLGVDGEMGKKRVFDGWFFEEVIDVSIGRWGLCVRGRDEDVGADLGLVDGFVRGGDSDIGLGDKESVIRIMKRSIGIGFDFED